MKKLLSLVALLSIHLVGAGQQVSNFTLTNTMNGASVSLNDYASSTAVIIIFTSNGCPYDEYYLNRIKKIIQEYSSKNVGILLVNSLLTESPLTMRDKGQQCGFSVPYLSDKEQTLMQALGASKTPESFLLKNSDGKFTIVYHGAIDDNAQVESDVHHSYFKNAIDAFLAGKTIESNEVRPVGCTIRKK